MKRRGLFMHTKSETLRCGLSHQFFIQPPIEGLTKEERMMELANTMSLWEKRPANAILASERDVIARVIEIADENKDKKLHDTHILLAVEDIIKDEFHEAKFHLEALLPDHRQELIKRAIAIKNKGGT